jgi:hypothetical protein
MGMVGQPPDVGDGVAGAGPGAESRAADIDGIRTVVDGGDAEIGVFSRGEEFEELRHESGLDFLYYLRQPYSK